MNRLTCLLWTATLFFALACSTEQVVTDSDQTSLVPSAPPEPSSMVALIPQGAEVSPGLLTGGQPSRKQFAELEALGLRTVINLRSPTERGTIQEPAWVEALGFEYVSMPIEGGKDLTEAAARQLDAVLREANGPTLVHCGSSNRVGALFALRAFYVENKTVEEALEVGRAAGLTRLEAATRRVLRRAAAG